MKARGRRVQALRISVGRDLDGSFSACLSGSVLRPRGASWSDTVCANATNPRRALSLAFRKAAGVVGKRRGYFAGMR